MHSTARYTALLLITLGAFMLLVAWVLNTTSSNAQANPLRGELGGHDASLRTESALPDSSPTSTPACGLAWRGVQHAGTSLGTQLNGIAAISPSDMWAVGYVPSGVSPFVEHWDGTAWTAVPIEPVPGNFTMFNDVIALASNDVWAVGQVGWSGASSRSETLVQHWDGTAWSRVLAMNPADRYNSFGAVTALAANDIWAVGYASSGADGYKRSMIQHWDGTSWSVVPSPTLGTRDNRLRDVTAIAPNDAWAVGHYDDYPDPIKTLLLHWDGIAWTAMQGVDPNPSGGHLYTVAAVAPDDVWAAGNFGLDPMLMLHWDGTRWTAVEAPDNFEVHGLYARTPQDVWAVGKDERAHWNGTQWSLVPGPRSSLQDVVAFAPDQAWAVGPVVERYSDSCAITTATPTEIAPTSTFTALPGATPTTTFTRTPLPTIPATCTITPTGTPPGPIPTQAPCSLITVYALRANFDEGNLAPFVSSVVLTDTGGWDIAYEGYSCAGYDFAAAAPDPPSVSDQRLTTLQTYMIPANALEARLNFYHSYAFQPSNGGYRDGGVLELSTDSGQSWFDAGPRIFLGGYYGTITRTGETCNGITPPFSNGQSAWVGAGSGLVRVDLSEFAGQRIMFRFRLGTDCSGGGQEWHIDDLSVTYTYRYMCTPTAIPTLTRTPTLTPTSTSCNLTFSDVPPTNTFYPFVRCLACRGIVQGYPCGAPGEPCDPESRPFFRPNNPVTRGQVAKIVSESAQFYDPVPSGQQTFADVPYGSPFWLWVERLASRGIMSGYPCGGLGEPCDEQNRPYFRPGAGATRGQVAKIDEEAIGFLTAIPDTQQTFADVPPNSTFWLYIERLLINRPGIMQGYPCGQQPNEPCDSENRPYFRPNTGVTRGQTSKIVAETFYPGCSPP